MRAYIKYETAEFNYQKDMQKILAYLREHGELNVSGTTVEDLYRVFSGAHCAGWLIATDERIQEFADWLNEIEI